jgi:uncharacterized protein (DUF1501 family)
MAVTIDRRRFLRRSIAAALGGTALFSPLGQLKVMAAAAQPQGAGNDYRALVCVFLFGGNDSFNAVMPFSAAHYADYRGSRQQLIANGGLAFEQAQIQAQALSPLADGLPGDGGSYGLHPSLAGLRGLFNGGQAAIVANVGTLLRPVTQAAYQAGTVAVPPQLFSHSDQSVFWQTSRPDDANANGWGGRVADLLHAQNPGVIPMAISLAGNNPFQRGALTSPYGMSPGGISAMSYLGDGPESWVIGAGAADAAAYEALLAHGTQAHLLERAFAQANQRAIAAYEIIGAALDGQPPLVTPFPDSSLGNQLAMVARLIQARQVLGMRRQVYFCAVGGYDTHSFQVGDQAYLLAQLSEALVAFHAATTALGVANDVTTFTASDFGRTLGINGDGTDHGWGGHHVVVGGAVRGQRFYGAMPSLRANANPDDTGYGQIIPTTSVDQYAATLARWLGVANGELADIFPSLGNFASADLGFMT